MKKQILNTIGLAAIATLLCVTCGDNGLDTSPKKVGDVDRFLDRINSTDTTGGGTPPTPTMYTLTVSATSGGTVLPSGTRSYADGTTVNVTATASNGYEFTGWTGTGAPTPATTNPVTVTINADKTLTANFRESSTPNPTTYTLTIAATSGGTVSPAAGTRTYPADTTVRVTATATSDYEFTQWTGTGAPTPATTNPVTVTMNANKTLTANFKQSSTPNPTTHTVMFNINGGSGTTPSAQTVYAGSSITLPNGSGLTMDGYTFGGWNTSTEGTGTNYNASSSYTPTASITLYAKWSIPPTVTTFTDDRDRTVYRKITIGTQTWMAENLNYDDPFITSDVCYNGSDANCDKYGRLYDWPTAMAGMSSSPANPSGVPGVCPAGWHLPSAAEWTVLVNYAGGDSIAGMKLKSTSGWNSNGNGNGNGTDDYGFSALPGGGGFGVDYFIDANYGGYWWSTTDNGADGARCRNMRNDNESVYWSIRDKTNLFSVRCVQDP